MEAAGASLFRRPKFVHERVYRQTSAVLDYDVRFDPLSCFSELVELFELEFKFVGVFRSRRGWCSKKLKLRVVANCFHRICQTIAGTCGSTTPKIRKAKHPLSFSRAGAQFWRRSVRLCSGQALLTQSLPPLQRLPRGRPACFGLSARPSMSLDSHWLR